MSFPVEIARVARSLPKSRIAQAFGLLAASSALCQPAFACDTAVSVCARATPGSFALIANGRPASVVVDAGADPAVLRVADAFAGDVARVAGPSAARAVHALPASGPVVLVGVVGQSPLLDQLVARGKLSAEGLAGRWEGFRQAVVDNPFPGIARALVVVGADRRGAVFGTYDLSEKIGVSPWAWWADVPVARRANVFVTAGQRFDAPRVRYRGIFINDEEPSFGTWGRRTFGGINSRLYEHVFDLTLRLKGNYVWPAMWGKAIARDDPRSMALADAMGVVLGTSHHEPMTRAQAEWHGEAGGAAGGGKWDYVSNGANLRAFWRGGIERMMSKGDGKGYDQLVTVGMRGDGDEPMGEGTAIGLLERIVADQRTIIADVTKRPAARTPQVWALYKEVQDYYDKGMKVPGDVTLLFADDNWGQVRRLPTTDLQRPGGFGVYYHFDYVGGPRSYKWIDTVQVEKTWQQMELSYRRGAQALWIVNVGDLKPLEYPIDFFLKMAWNPDAMTADALAAYPKQWAQAQFGDALAPEIGAMVTDYSRLTSRRKPEFLDADSFALGPVGADALDGGEFGRMVAAWRALSKRMIAVRDRLAPDQRDTYHQLLEYPIAAMTNLYELQYAVAWNRQLAPLGDARADVFADRAEAAFRRDAELADGYHAIGGGKWAGMMLQPHIGYTSWRDPKANIMPAVTRVAKPGAAAPVIAFRTSAPVGAATASSVEAGAFARAVNGKGLTWRAIAGLGRTAGAIGAFPQGAPATTAGDGVRVEYAMTLRQAGDATLRLYMVPTLDTRGGDGLHIGVSIDDGPVRTLGMNLKVDSKDWERAMRDNAFALEARFPGLSAGRHTVKVWRIDDNMLVQRIELFTGTLPESYLGPAATP